MTGGTFLTVTAGLAASAAGAPQSLAATAIDAGGVGGSVTSAPVVWQCQPVKVPATPPPTTPPPTTPPTTPTTPPTTPTTTPPTTPPTTAPASGGSSAPSSGPSSSTGSSAPPTTPAATDSGSLPNPPPTDPTQTPQSPATSTSSSAGSAPATATLTAFHAAAAAPQPALCVSVQRSQDKIARGQAATWQVGVWAQNGDASNVTIHLAAAPSGRTAAFSVGCGNQDGSTACDLGTVFSTSSQRQVLAKIAVPASATSETSVTLTAKLTATNLVKSPTAAVDVGVAAPGTPGTTGGSTTTGGGISPASGLGNSGVGTSTSQLPVGSLPTIGGPGGTSLQPGGNASGLFPTVNPSSVPSPAPNSGSGVAARQAGNTEAMPIGGTPVIDAQLAGLGTLGVAFMLAVTRLSVRKRPGAASKSAAAATTSGPKDPGTPPAPATPEPPEQNQA